MKVPTVKEYIGYLFDIEDQLLGLCNIANEGTDGKTFNCNRCVLNKAEGKACPVYQLRDIREALEYALENSTHGITEDMLIDDPMVVLFIKRAVIMGNSVYTLRSCDDDYVKLRNLLVIS